MKTVLIVTLMFAGAPHPTQHVEPMNDLATCEAQAHEFLTHKFVGEVQAKLVFRSAACALDGRVEGDPA